MANLPALSFLLVLLHNRRVSVCILVAMSVFFSLCCFGITSIYYVLLILFLYVLQFCVMHISAFSFIFTSNKVETENFTLYLEKKVTKFVLVLLEEQVPCSGVNLHEITLFCA